MRQLLILILFVFLLFYFFPSKNNIQEYTVSGSTMGKIPYVVKYVFTKNVLRKNEIDSILTNFNNMFSTYIPDSEISIINRSKGKIDISNEFFFLLSESKKIYKLTNGYFDPTVGPLVNLWGFGPQKIIQSPSISEINNVKKFVGFDELDFGEYYIIKKTENTYLDFSSIAKGYAVDVLSEYLIRKNILNFFIEVGGEVRANGINISGDEWVVGIENPFDEISRLYASIPINNKSIATSGNYKNFYSLNDSIFFHSINPKTGYPAYSNMISSSVISENCFISDAYATSFMILGFEESKKILNDKKDLDALLIYTDSIGSVRRFITEGIKDKIKFVK